MNNSLYFQLLLLLFLLLIIKSIYIYIYIKILNYGDSSLLLYLQIGFVTIPWFINITY